MKLCVSAFAFEKNIRAGEMTLADCIVLAREIGYDAIEFVDLPGRTLDEQKELAYKLHETAGREGIEIAAYTVEAGLSKPDPKLLDAEVQRLRGLLETAKILGAGILRHDSTSYSWKPTPSGLLRSYDAVMPIMADAARRVAEYGAELGIRTCTENHGMYAQDPHRLERLFNTVAHDNYSLLIDIGNFTGIGIDHCDAVGLLAPYAIHVHCKDFLIRDEPTETVRGMTRNGKFYREVPLGEGDVPVRRCLEILKAAGYDGMISCEYSGVKKDGVEGITKGYHYLKKTLAEIDWL